MLPTLSARDARILLMRAQGLLDDPARRATPATVSKVIERLGFVQLDSINIVDRAHHLTLASRLEAYRPQHLTRLLEGKRSLFEHFTHDCSAIPTLFFPHWKPRFEGYRARWRDRGWVKSRMGDDPDGVIAHVLDRIHREGPLMSKNFEHDRKGKSAAWWGWKPQKTALEYLWLSGTLSIAGRRNFHKVYDLTERVFPDLQAAPTPSFDEHLEWACTSALERLGVATPGEIARFWQAVRPDLTTKWCRKAEAEGRITAVHVAAEDSSRLRKAYALPDYQQSLRRAPAAPEGIRLLSPFDPVIRDRRRLRRLFDFDYRFEAFVPAPQRRWGYYVLPLLEGERFVGRLDAKHHRHRETFEVKTLYWEPRVRAGKQRLRRLQEALAVLAKRIGARSIELPAPPRR
jgi:uncharacterized protein YcaQ